MRGKRRSGKRGGAVRPADGQSFRASGAALPILNQPAPPAADHIEFDNIDRPKPHSPEAVLTIGGTRVDMHLLRFAGMAYGPEDSAVTLGFLAGNDTNAAWSGVTIVAEGLTRFELSFQEGEPGALEYVELRRDPEESFLLFFEGGTIRLSAARIRGELLAEDSGEASVQ